MPFFVHQLTRSASGAIIAQRPHAVRLPGNGGPFRRHAEPLFARAPEGMLPWHLDETQVLRLLDASPADCALIVDLKPDHPTEVSLYRLRHVWGHS